MIGSTPFRCVLVGADSLLIECGETLLAKRHTVAAVAAGSDRVADWARSKGLRVIDARGPASSWSPSLEPDSLDGEGFDWLFSITHLAMLPDDVIARADKGAINFHDGPLPAYAGLNTPAWALMRGEQTYGITWHVITSGIDEGDILKQRTFDVAAAETSLSLNTRNFEAAIETFAELVDELAEGRQQATPQDRDAPRTTFSRHDRPEGLGILDWSRPAVELDRLVRALDFGRYPNPLGVAKLWSGDRFVLVTATELTDDDDTADAPGTVRSVDDDQIVVATADGPLTLTAFATPTGVELTAADVATRFGLTAGTRLPLLDDERRTTLTALSRKLSIAERRHLATLAGLEPVELPWARTAPAEHTPRYSSVEVSVPATLADDPSIGAAFATVLARLSGKDHFHIALADPAVADGFDAAAPHLFPAVPFEVSLSPEADFTTATAAFVRSLEQARTRGPVAYELIAREPDLARLPELQAGRLLPLALRLGGDSSPDDGVVLEVQRSAGGWRVRYDEGLVAVADAQLFASCLEALLRDVTSRPTTPLTQVDLLGPDVRHQVLESWNDTARDVRTDACIHHLFEEQVDRTPETRAVVFEDRSLTYRELEDRANQLAAYLRTLGVGPDSLVGVHLDRGLDLLVAVLGVQKAGGAYVPLDPTYPHDRLEHMIRDSGCQVILTDNSVAAHLPLPAGSAAVVVRIDGDRELIDRQPAARRRAETQPHHLAYCIYTSGSTGMPKGVLIEHRNAVNFFDGMDECVPHELPATWFAVTSLSFDISVLELLYTVTRGFTVVVYLDRDRAPLGTPSFVEQNATKPIDFSLFYFSGDEAESTGADKYRLLLEGARWADDHGFCAVWTPERHFHAFGGLYPQPAVTGAAVAAITKNVAIRAGSVVMPLHHPIRVAESWSIVDNLSNGRVGLSVAAGWQPNDFVLMPQNYANAKQAMFDGLDVVKRLWRGETVTFPGATGKPVEIETLPRPVQSELPVWITTAGNPETYVQAGRIGANVLTHLLGQTVEQLQPKIEAYRRARAEAGFDPDAGVVTLMLHTFVGDDEDEVRAKVREPLKQYLGTSFSLLKEHAWAFPAFQKPGGAPTGIDDLADEDFKNLSEDDLDAVLEFAFLRYYETSGLFGTPERCLPMIDNLKSVGVDEIACLIDFGVATDTVLQSLPTLDAVRALANAGTNATAGSADLPASDELSTLDQSVAAQLTRHGVTHLQCTPSMARILTMQDDSREALAGVDHVFIGGEAFPVALAKDLRSLVRTGNVTNMYGPTETTIWSTTWPLQGNLETIPIGTPIANTRIYILDKNLQPQPPGVAGDLWIGGAGVVRGYHRRAELTAERFVPDPFRADGSRMYVTGDLARWRQLDDGSAILEYLGRNDHQVKIRGYRIELGEIAAQIGRYPGVLECVVVVREDTPGDQQLVGFLSLGNGALGNGASSDESAIDPADVKQHLRANLPDAMIPNHIVVLAELPHTPNGKIDRNALPSLAELLGARASGAAPVAADNDLERDVLAIWEDVLGRTGIGVNDNFFDIGGHSLLVVRVHRRLRETLVKPVALTDLYRFPTIRTFASSLSSDTAAVASKVGADRAARRRETLQRRRSRL